jgi:DNA-binding transcriptional ArsR family regulator
MTSRSSISEQVARDLQPAADLLRALGNPIRLAIVSELGSEPRCVHELVDRLDAAQPLVSQHLRILRGARLVSTERRGKEVVYTLTDDHVSHIALDAIRHSQEGHP